VGSGQYQIRGVNAPPKPFPAVTAGQGRISCGCPTETLFISYRRDDSAAYAGRLCDRLSAVLGAHRVFMDVQGIQPGENFAKAIEQVLAQCSTVLVVIGPRWRKLLDPRPAHNEQDYVVHEIAAALSAKKTVVPVLVGGTPVSSLGNLPAALTDLSFHQAVELHDSSFDDDCDRLLKRLRQSGAVPLALKKPALWIAAATILALSVLTAARMGLGPWRASHERKLHLEQLLHTARAQAEQTEYESAFESYEQILRLDSENKAAQDGQVDAAMRWLENFHVLASEGQRPEEVAAPQLVQLKGALEAALARTNGKDTRAADILAHLGWAHYMNEKIAFKEYGNAERYFQQALAIAPTNVYACVFLGNWLLQTGGDRAQALSHFQTALATNQERSFVRSLQLGGLYHNDAPGMRGELVKALNEMRVNREPLDKRLQGRLSYLYSSTVSTAAELREVLTAVALDDAWKTYLWLNPERPGDSTVERDFVHANLTEISGDRATALAEFKALAVALRAQQRNGRIADYTAAAVTRLSQPPS
jgi:tetratricopeptide (TPR) repeat protein